MPFKNKKTAPKKAKSNDEEYDNTNRGVLFENTDKVKKTHPDYRGSFTDADGNEFWLSAWEKESRDGLTYLSIAATAKEVEEDDEEEELDETVLPVKRSKKKK